MNVIKCKHEYSDGEVSEWTVSWAVTKRMKGATHLCIEGRGSVFDVIIGKYDGGNFLCIPAIDVGCGLASFNDTLWNYEKLSKFVTETDAATITRALKHFGMKEKERAEER
ncbi:MAG: hypothetical protein K5894_02050 [Lachnospiraceae bacterium]|nr:hypothetical protein [Lachnospiraceae bacterium]